MMRSTSLIACCAARQTASGVAHGAHRYVESARRFTTLGPERAVRHPPHCLCAFHWGHLRGASLPQASRSLRAGDRFHCQALGNRGASPRALPSHRWLAHVGCAVRAVRAPGRFGAPRSRAM